MRLVVLSAALLLVVVQTFVTTDQWCPANERMDSCGYRCDPTCYNANTAKQRRCVKDCHGPTCTCDNYHYRNPEGKCVSRHVCRTQHQDMLKPSNHHD